MLQGRSADPYDLDRLHDGLTALFGPDAPWYGWHYPPFFLALAALLALMTHALSLAVWKAASFALYLLSIRAILSRVPSCTESLLSLLIATAFSGGLHQSRPRAEQISDGGAARGRAHHYRPPANSFRRAVCLAYKPQFGLLMPLVLAASGRWRVFASAAVAVLFMTFITTIALGPEVWSSLSHPRRSRA